MATNRFRISALLVIVTLALAFGAIMRDDGANAQPPAAPPTTVGRFQISAYTGNNVDGLNPGCYIVDTATGKVWHTRLGAGLVEVTKQPLVGSP